MRQFVWVVAILAIIAPVGLWYFNQNRQSAVETRQASLMLTNRPSTFCPQTARVVAVKSTTPTTVHFEGEATVADCAIVKLPTEQLAEAVEYQLFVSIERARAFRVVVAGPLNSAVASPIQLGDINSDNVINEIDARGVEAALGRDGTAAEFDVDADGKVTILDYSLVQVNQGAGVDRPDGKLWSAI